MSPAGEIRGDPSPRPAPGGDATRPAPKPPGLRQRMAWIHGWLGLLSGWLLFAICLTGTASYYRDEISQWMRPELQRATMPEAPAARAGFAADGVTRSAVDVQAGLAERAVARLHQRAPGSASWFINLPEPRNPELQIAWTAPGSQGSAEPRGPQTRSRRFAETLDPATGAELPLGTARATRGGDFFYVFHFTLHYLPPREARWFVGLLTLFMLAAIVSGVVTHRRIFSDFFTFRPGKGQRSWLDAHNVVGVLALPYHLVITYSGLVTLMILMFPWGVDAVYGAERNRFFVEALPQQPAQVAASGTAAAMMPIGPLLARASAHWGGAPVGRISINRPGDANAVVVLTRGDTRLAEHDRQRLTYRAVDGDLLRVEGEDAGAAERTRSVLYGLHLGRFADGGLRALLFLSGLACCALVATGSLLWTRKRVADGRGKRFVEGMNIGAIAGAVLAVAAFFWANRVLPVGMSSRGDWEIHAFFIAWAAATVAGLGWPTREMWVAQLALAAVAYAALPLATLAWTPARPTVFDAALLGCGLALAAAAWRLGVRHGEPARRGAGARVA